MNHVYIGLGNAARDELRHFQQHYELSAMDADTNLHAEYFVVTENELPELYLLDNGLLETQDTPHNIQTIKVDAPSLKSALLYLREHRWLKMDAEEQVYWTELIEDDVENIDELPRRILRLSLAPTIEQVLYHVHAAYLRLQSKYDDEGLALHLLVDTSSAWVNAILSDVIVQLRQHYPSLFCRLSVYLLLPANFSQTKLPPIQSAGLYATLVEFNALLNNAWMPENLLNILPLHEDGNWVEVCYMVESDGEEHDAHGLSGFLLRKSTVKEQVWQETFADEFAHFEDNQLIKKDNFVSFGMLRLAISVDYPTEYYKKLFIEQVLNALLYANWQEKTGYVAHDNHEVRQQFIQNLDQLMQDWCLDFDYLTLNKLMTNDQSKLHPKWTSIELEWQRNRAERISAVEELPAAQRGTALVQKYMDFFKERFRLKGVQQFYQMEWPENRVDGLAFKIVSGIEKTLISQWWNESRGLADLPAMIVAILDYLEQQSVKFNFERRSHEKKAVEYLELYENYVQEKVSKGKGRLFSSSSVSLPQLDEYLYVAFTERTHVSALLFAERLLQRLKLRLKNLHEQISQIFDTLTHIREKHSKVLHQIEQISSKGTWVSDQRDSHMQQVALNVHLETEKMHEQVFALPFEIKNYVGRFKTHLREIFWQHTNFNVFTDYLVKLEFQTSLDKISEAYADHLDFKLSGGHKRPETSDLITETVRLTPENKFKQFVTFVSSLTQKPEEGYLPSTKRQQVQVRHTDSKLFAPAWVKTVNSQMILAQMLYTSGLQSSDIQITPDLNNYLDLVNVYHLDMKAWPAIVHMASVYQNSLDRYDDVKRAYFQWHAEHRLVDWYDHGLIEPEYTAEDVRYIVIKAYAVSLINVELKGTDIRLTLRDSNQMLTDDFAPLATVIKEIKVTDLVSLERKLKAVTTIHNLSTQYQRRLEQLLHQFKQSFFELDEEEDEEWMAAGLFVAWQRTTQKVLQELMQE
ncbi:hypothetical protein LVJ82_15670 [Vitreoscilla massiliensis]|uniref:Uncharacterized protein n=1 Tax=Vitreoscilla massiliensis TaxID=1689272 RepID=A0ABY4E259_9NEIS|nr:hypothetical protein [Vitreoscilla massiliensis]UOO88875.1 hypothetical protein LVJ82_15670 [Vitreoscilla massiliensis]